MSQKRERKKKGMEILAPAGSYETLRAVFEAGADAVYLGGSMFGARAFANNFTEEELLDALDYAHLRGKKIYLTVNTLLKNQELAQLVDYLRPYYEHGLDAVLVQDMGALRLIHQHFPDMEIHTSTQMTVTGIEGVRYLQQFGVSRVVMAREVSIAEMKRIHEETGMELEAFVHGALCYCYSGQCLFSSMLGGRSGNRGRCAQPCRLSYGVLNEQNQTIKKESYVLSLKDLCGIRDLKQLYDAGVYSLKIEGRMKSPDYAAGVAAIYRKYRDQILMNKSGEVKAEDEKHLAELGSRCGFTNHYYYHQNGRNMVTFDKPNLTYQNPAYHEQVHKTYVEQQAKIPICGHVSIQADMPILFEVWKGQVSSCASGSLPSQAQKKPLSEADLLQRMNKTGDSPFVFESLTVDLEDGLFLPNGALNQLRRDALELLKEELLQEYRRSYRQPEIPSAQTAVSPQKECRWSASAETMEQLEKIIKRDCFGRIYANIRIFSPSDHSRLTALLAACHDGRKELWLSLPAICRSQSADSLRRQFAASDFPLPDGFLVRNYEELGLIRELFPSLPLQTDHNLYCFNDLASAAYLENGAEEVTMPLELNVSEIANRVNNSSEMILYGYYPLMTSAGCVHANSAGCNHKPGIRYLKDRYRTLFPVCNVCSDCYNIIYNSLPVCLLSQAAKLQKYGLQHFRIAFTIENAEQVDRVLDLAEIAMRQGTVDRQLLDTLGPVTGGHFKRGVE